MDKDFLQNNGLTEKEFKKIINGIINGYYDGEDEINRIFLNGKIDYDLLSWDDMSRILDFYDKADIQTKTGVIRKIGPKYVKKFMLDSSSDYSLGMLNMDFHNSLYFRVKAISGGTLQKVYYGGNTSKNITIRQKTDWHTADERMTIHLCNMDYKIDEVQVSVHIHTDSDLSGIKFYCRDYGKKDVPGIKLPEKILYDGEYIIATFKRNGNLLSWDLEI